MLEQKKLVQEVTMIPIEVDLDERTLETLEFLSERTGFTIDKLVEYAVADRIIQDALAERRTLKKE